jgi:hypothetical protein
LAVSFPSHSFGNLGQVVGMVQPRQLLERSPVQNAMAQSYRLSEPANWKPTIEYPFLLDFILKGA